MRVLCCSLVLALAALAGCSGGAEPSAHDTADPAPSPVLAPSPPFTAVRTVALEGLDGAAISLDAWVADTPELRALGLMHRRELSDTAGMLFVFPEPHRGGFWMKNTLIPLSIAYLGQDGRILAIMDMEPCEADLCPTYDPGVEYVAALEVNQGWFAARGVTTGWMVATP